ncbi:unnamed protein product, partial [Phaeothamnion confervicola]
WHDLCASPEELRPEFTLNMGQCFNWREASPHTWTGVLGSRVLAIRQTPETTLYSCLSGLRSDGSTGTYLGAGGSSKLEQALRQYFQLDTPLAPLRAGWAAADARMAAVAEGLPGVRVVRQDPLECLFSFICSSNNNIARITLMLSRLRRKYGQPLPVRAEGGRLARAARGEVDQGAAGDRNTYHAFPTLEVLCGATEEELRGLGFGYRARYVVETAELLRARGGRDWLLGLRGGGRLAVQEALTAFSGVGRKVADCTALFSLDQDAAIPVDTHVWRIACRDFDPNLQRAKSITPVIYERVGDLFRARYTQRAGWAHSTLFAAELPPFRARLQQALVCEMEEFRASEKAAKAEAKGAAKAAKAAASTAASGTSQAS